MIIAERENLTQVKVLVHNPDIELVLWEDSKGNMFVQQQAANRKELFISVPPRHCYASFLKVV